MKLARGSLIQMMPVCVRGHLEITFFFFKCSEDLKWNLPPGRRTVLSQSKVQEWILRANLSHGSGLCCLYFPLYPDGGQL